MSVKENLEQLGPDATFSFEDLAGAEDMSPQDKGLAEKTRLEGIRRRWTKTRNPRSKLKRDVEFCIAVIEHKNRICEGLFAKAKEAQLKAAQWAAKLKAIEEAQEGPKVVGATEGDLRRLLHKRR